LRPCRPKKIAGGFQQAGKKEWGLGEGIFARLLCPPKAGCRVGAFPQFLR